MALISVGVGSDFHFRPGLTDHHRQFPFPFAFPNPGKILFDEPERLRLADVPGNDNRHRLGPIMIAKVFEKILSGNPLNDLCSSPDVPPRRLIAIQHLVEKIFHMAHRVVAVHVKLGNDRPAFAINFGRREEGVQKYVRDDVHGDFCVFPRHFHEIPRPLVGCEGVVNRPDFVQHPVNLRRRGPAPRPLKYHVLQEMRNAVFLFRLVL